MKKKHSQKTLDIPKITLPYLKGTTDIISKILRRNNITVAFAPKNTIRNLLDKAKDPIDPRQQKCVYKILCSCGKVYIGETGRSPQKRLKEHTTDICRDRSYKYVLTEHSHNTSHHICIDKMRLLAREEHYTKRRIREAVEIEKRNNTLNRGDNLKLNNSWKPVIDKLKRSQNQ